MPQLVGGDRGQAQLLPASADDYVGTENPVRFLEAFVEGLDLEATGFIARALHADHRTPVADICRTLGVSRSTF